MLIDDEKFRGILIVDDEKEVRDFVETSLRQAGYQKFYIAGNGLKALELISIHGAEIYAVVLDLRMPEMDGHEFIIQLIKIHCHHVGIIIFTGYYSNEIENEYKTLHSDLVKVNNIVQKPEITELVQDVKNTLIEVHDKRRSNHDKLITLQNESFKEINKKLDKLSKFNDSKSASHQNDYLQNINKKLDSLLTTTENIRNSQKNWVEQIGMEVLKTIIIAIFLILFFKVTFSDLVWEFLSKKKDNNIKNGAQIDKNLTAPRNSDTYKTLESELQLILSDNRLTSMERDSLVSIFLKLLLKN